AALDVGMRRRRVREGVRAIDDDPQVARGDRREVAGDEVMDARSAQDQLGSEEHTGQALVVASHRRDVEWLPGGAPGVADRDDPAPVRQAVEALLERLPA